MGFQMHRFKDQKGSVEEEVALKIELTFMMPLCPSSKKKMEAHITEVSIQISFILSCVSN